MTNLELSDQFDVIFNNITSNQAPGLDEYEKSVLLTKALDQIIKAYFSPKTNKVMEGYDDSQRRNIDFSTLTTTEIFSTSSEEFKIIEKDYSACYRFPTNIISVLNEVVKVTNADSETKVLLVIPIAYDLFTSLMNKPHKLPVKNSAWRLFTGYAEQTTDAHDDPYEDASLKPYPVILIIAHKTETLGEYKIRYIRKPKPIILATFDNVTIEGIGAPWCASSENACELPKELQPEVVQRAVELAKAIYLGDLSTLIQVGSASQTDIGFVSSGGSKRE